MKILPVAKCEIKLVPLYAKHISYLEEIFHSGAISLVPIGKNFIEKNRRVLFLVHEAGLEGYVRYPEHRPKLWYPI